MSFARDEATEKKIAELIGNFIGMECSARAVPVREPVQGTNECEGGNARICDRRKLTAFYSLAHDGFEQVEIFAIHCGPLGKLSPAGNFLEVHRGVHKVAIKNLYV